LVDPPKDSAVVYISGIGWKRVEFVKGKPRILYKI
jgi:hypothetical protein